MPANITLWFLRGGELNISSGKTVTINGPIDAGLHQIFAGNGDVLFGSGCFREVYPQWWGAEANGIADDTDELQACFDSIAEGQKIVIPPGTYDFNDTLTLNKNHTILDCQGRLKWTKETAGTAILIGGRSGDITAFTNPGGGKTTVHSESHGLSNDTRVLITDANKYSGYRIIEDVTTDTFNIVEPYEGPEDGFWGIGNAGITASLSLDNNSIDWSVNSNGVQVVNLSGSDITIRRCVGFQRGLKLCGESYGVAYNKFVLDYMIENKIGVDFSPARAGYCNENTFYGGRFSYYSNAPRPSYEGTRFVNIPHYATHRINNNRFYSPSFECDDDPPLTSQPEYYVYCDGISNAFIHPRNEGTASSGYNVCFDGNSIGNVWIAGTYKFNLDTFDDDGSYNSIETRTVRKWGPLTENAQYGTITAPGTIEGGSITTAGTIEGENINATGDISGTNIEATGNITAGNITADALRLQIGQSGYYQSIIPIGSPGEDESLSIDLNDNPRTVSFTGNPTLGDWFNQNVKNTSGPTFDRLALTAGTSNPQIKIGTSIPSFFTDDGVWDSMVAYHSRAGLRLANSATSSSSQGAGVIGYSFDSAPMGSGHRLGFCLFGGSTGPNSIAHGGGIVGYADGNWDEGSAPSRMTIEVVPTGVTGGRWVGFELKSDRRVFLSEVHDNDIGAERELLIDSDGQLGVDVSSIRYKENVENLTQTDIDKVLQLRPVTYDRKDGKQLHQYGFIAEEVNALFPEFVSYKRNVIWKSSDDGFGGEIHEVDKVELLLDESGNPIPETVNYRKMIVLAIKLVQELKQENQMLKDDIVRLKEAVGIE